MASKQETYQEASERESIFKKHAFPEHTVDLGEVRMNYAVAGSDSNPAILLIPAQAESWWGYEDAMHLLAESYQVYAVDLRGQGRSTWTPGRYSLDNFGNDLVKFIDLVIKRPVIVSGLSSGGVLSAWLSAFAKPGQVLACVYEDPPLFASELTPAVGHGIRQTIAGPIFRIWHKWLGPQWSVGNTEGMQEAMAHELPSWISRAMTTMLAEIKIGPVPPELREYDPEWAEVFSSGRLAAGCDHENMLRHVKVPVLLTHHYRKVDPESGGLAGAISDEQAEHVKKLVEGGGNSFTYKSFPKTPHSMHGHDPACYVATVTAWLDERGLGKALRPSNDKPATTV
ncbi:hypothetical protein INS49_015170 [Diaporthe citri]|uniref:uncharacterized protein n=1 Tax=Diaporthe citri TaxID=83186 RepID=UPI001C803E2F|nr:uncharacterized protein INS49_015170 [Diaporthe citri]KAG6357292.1 hypothetical protein INS49_015170 [Diaporthe citri]